MADTLCMYDRPMVDDEVGAMLDSLPQDLRVFMVSDTCNSGYVRSVTALQLCAAPCQFVDWRRIAFRLCISPRVLMAERNRWTMGGVWTHVLDVFLKPGITYRDWFTAAQAHMPPSQIPSSRRSHCRVRRDGGAQMNANQPIFKFVDERNVVVTQTWNITTRAGLFDDPAGLYLGRSKRAGLYRRSAWIPAVQWFRRSVRACARLVLCCRSG